MRNIKKLTKCYKFEGKLEFDFPIEFYDELVNAFRKYVIHMVHMDESNYVNSGNYQSKSYWMDEIE